MAAVETSAPSKGNIVRSKRNGRHGTVLAVRKDGTRAKLYVFGPDREVWVNVDAMTVEVSGNETCWKCQGSGLYYFGGTVLNGVYQGQTGPCYGCGGKGIQNDEDRIRCHYYWHRKISLYETAEEMQEALDEARNGIAQIANR